MSDQKISQFSLSTSLLAGDYLPIARGSTNQRISYADLVDSIRATIGLSSFVLTFMGREGAVVLESADLNGLSGAGLTGIGTGTGGVINTGSTTIGADSDSNGVGVVALQTRTLNRFLVNNDGTINAPTNTTIALADPASPGINFRNSTSGIATTMEWWGGTGGVPGMPYDLGAYFSSVAGFYTGREVVISNKRSNINGTIQGVSALTDGSEPSMLSISPDVNGPSIAAEAHGAMGAGFENQSILAGYDLDDPNGGGAGAYSPFGFGNKRFAISARGEMFWGPLVDDPAANATARLKWDLASLITITPAFRVLNPDGEASVTIDGKSDSNSRLIFKTDSGAEKWTLNQLNTIGGANPWLSLTTPAGPNALVFNGANGNIGVSQDADAFKVSVTGDVNCTGAFYVDGVKVLGNRGAAIANATDAATAISQLNLLLAVARTHGQIAT